MGIGSIDLGNGIPGSQFQVRVTKSTGLMVKSCELREDSSSTLAIAQADPDPGGTFFSDPYGTAFGDLTAVNTATTVYVTFSEATFMPGKRLSGSGQTYSVYCQLTGFNPSSSMQVSISSDVLFFFFDDTDTSHPITGTNKIKNLPLDGTGRASN